MDSTEKYVKRTYKIDVDCANCASKVEAALKNVEGVQSASINFMGKQLTVIIDSANEEKIIENIISTAKKTEPDCEIFTSESEPTASNPEIDHEHHVNHEYPVMIIRIAVSVVFFIAGFLFKENVRPFIFAAAYIISGYDVVLKAVTNIFHGKIFDENFLMTVASIGSFAMKDFPEAVAVMVLYQIGEYFQDKAVEHSRKSISQLMDIRPDYANVLSEGEFIRVSPDTVKIGDIILVKPGEKIPLDGEITEGISSVNTVAITGESIPQDVNVGDRVMSGCVNISGMIKIKTTNTFGDSTVAKILQLVEESGNNKAASEKFITKFARVYTPAVCLLAVMLAIIPSLVTGNWSIWINRALTFLVISCPCALVISVPLSFYCGIGGASKKGILIKGANYIETLSKLDTIIFDKTGTLTKGVFDVTEIVPQGIDQNKLIEIAAYAESYSNHPISASLKKAYNKEIYTEKVISTEEIAGQGVKAIIKMPEGDVCVLCGNKKLMDNNGIKSAIVSNLGTAVHVAENGNYVGYIVISDKIKETSKNAVSSLKRLGIKQLIMLTGDREEAAKAVADQLELTSFHASLMPQDKVAITERIIEDNAKKQENSKVAYKVAFVGDGINDAPVLRRADLGIAMGALGSDAAIEAADVVLMDDDPAKLAIAVSISKKCMSIVKQNIVFALTVKLIILVLGAFGIAGMWLAVFADVGVAMIAILNAMRCMTIAE